mmetsp:Transcript_66657/g.168047  ORF Transcript_66657/g.168047 Transcript_66657/m.168047 type:complete len:141 (-) Transcript_66657:388-810(-)
MKRSIRAKNVPCPWCLPATATAAKSPLVSRRWVAQRQLSAANGSSGNGKRPTVPPRLFGWACCGVGGRFFHVADRLSEGEERCYGPDGRSAWPIEKLLDFSDMVCREASVICSIAPSDLTASREWATCRHRLACMWRMCM